MPEFNGHFPAGDAFKVAAPLPKIPPGEYLCTLINDLLAIKGETAMDRIAAKNTAHQAARVIATFCSPQGEYSRGWDQRTTLYTNDQLREALVASADECAKVRALLDECRQSLADSGA